MLSIVIADDKPSARKGLECMIDWKAEGVEVVSSAKDGREALEECRRLSPDILLTDIKMPLLSGLDVARELRREGVPTRLIFVSGYADFQFARDAVEVRAEGYLLKPVKEEELLRVVRATAASILREREQREDLAELRRRYREHLPLLRVSLLRELVSPESRAPAAEEAREQASALELSVRPGLPILAAVVRIDEYPPAAEERQAEERRILELSVERMLRNELRDDAAEVFRSAEGEITLFYQDEELRPAALAARLETLQLECRAMLGVSLSAGVGSPVADLHLVRQSHREARQAVQHRLYAGSSSVICHSSLRIPRDDAASASRPALKAEIIGAVEVGDTARLPDLLGRFYQTFRPEGPDLLPRLQAASAELLVAAAQSLLSFGAPGTAVSPAEVLPAIFSATSAHDVHYRVLEALRGAGAGLASRFGEQNSALVERVKQYVREHFAEEVSMQQISEAVFYSPNYVSLVFSKSAGQTIKEFVTETRVRHAKQLLRQSGKMVFEVAAECGYDPHYFSTVFKKATGVSPREYRDGCASAQGETLP